MNNNFFIRKLLKILPVALCFTGLIGNSHAQQTDKIISGYGYTVDGTTIIIGENKIRLIGVMAPNLDQIGKDNIGRTYKAGYYARDILASLIADQALGCRVIPQNGSEKDKKDRYYSICATSITKDISKAMLFKGWAMVDRSGETQIYDSYEKYEGAAKNAKKGIWQGEIEKPWIAN